MFYSLKRISNWYTTHNVTASGNAIKKNYHLHFPNKTRQYINIKANNKYDYQIEVGTIYEQNVGDFDYMEIYGMDHASCVYLVDQNRKEVEWQIKKFIM